MKTHWRKHEKTDFLGAVDVEEMGVNEISLTIDKVLYKEETVRGKKDWFRIAYFKQKGIKPMILNVTNSKAIKRVVNSKYLEHWENVDIVIYVKEGVRMGSEITEALRIKSVKKSITEEKKKKKIDDLRFSNAIDAIKTGQFTKNEMRDRYLLTPEQEKTLEVC